MKIIHVVESLAGAGGGLPAAVKSLARLQNSIGYKVEFAVTSRDAQYSEPIDMVVNRLKGLSFWSSLLKLYDLCCSIIFKSRYDFVHIHGLWNISFVILCIACKLGGTKYVITTHGQLLSTILNADSRLKRWKKKLYYWIFGRAILAGAFKVHVSSENERLEFLPDVALSKKVELIPHIIDPIFFKTRARLNVLYKRESALQFKDILFVGRLDPRKGVLDLIDGFARSELDGQWRLKIVGPSSDIAFMDLIVKKIAAAELSHRVLIERPVYGDSRAELYASCYIFCLPSYSEAPGLVNIEAALLSRPVITTPHTGLFDIAAGGGLLCDTGAKSISAALKEAAGWSDNEYAVRSKNIRRWAVSMHSLEVLIPRWKNFYS